MGQEVKKAPIELVIEDICLDKPSELPQELFSDIKVAGSGRSYAPRSYSPKGYTPKSYSPRSYVPRSYTPKSLYTPTKPVAVKGKNQYMPSKFGAVKGSDKKAIDLVIPDIVLDQPKEIVIKKDSFNPQRIVAKGYSPYTPKSYTPKSYSPKKLSYTPSSYNKGY